MSAGTPVRPGPADSPVRRDRADSPVPAGRRLLADAGVASPANDAELLAAHVLDLPRGRLALADWSPDARRRYAALLAERARRVPLQYLIGTAGFRRCTLAVGPGVFVPRPETECLLDWCLAALPAHPSTVVDLGAGCGAIALALADEVPGATVYAVERDPAAYRWLARNTAGTPVRIRLGDLATELAELVGTVDLVVSNPPYLPELLRGRLEPEVGEFEPEAALWGGGGDGLAALRTVAARAAALLRPGGLLAIEHGAEQGPEAVAALVEVGFSRVADHPDRTGRDRFVTARAGR
jgi:release factor glutamine methyltransferase